MFIIVSNDGMFQGHILDIAFSIDLGELGNVVDMLDAKVKRIKLLIDAVVHIWPRGLCFGICLTSINEID